jgi:hypothetical protein
MDRANQMDFMDLTFPAESMDGAYAIEATCHAPDRVKVRARGFGRRESVCWSYAARKNKDTSVCWLWPVTGTVSLEQRQQNSQNLTS